MRVAGDFLKHNSPDATLWLSNPTWANHGAIFAAAGVPTKSYDYFDKATNALDFDAMLYPSQGHAFDDGMHWLDEYGRIERFLTGHLGPP